MLPSLLSAETVILKNGQVFSAKVVNQDQNYVTLKTQDGKTRQLHKKEINKISYKSVQQVEIEIQKEKAQKAQVKKTGQKAEEKIAEEPQIEKPPGKFQNLKYSFLPGWGQLRQGRKKTAYAIMGGVALLAGITASSSSKQSSLESKYKNQTEMLFFQSYYFNSLLDAGAMDLQTTTLLYFVQRNNVESARKKTEKAAAATAVFGGLLAALYLYNLADVVIFQPTRTEQLSVFTGFQVSASDPQIGLRYELKF